MQMNDLAPRIEAVYRRIAEAAHRAGRNPAHVRLVAVTKEHPLSTVQAAVAAGLFDLGENRIGALEGRIRDVPDPRVRWHMMGRLQRRSAPALHGLAHWVHSVDSERLALRLDQSCPEGVAPLSILVQVNTSGEAQKGGVEPDMAVDTVGRILEAPNLRVEGLMTMAPFVEEEAVLRATFACLRSVQEQLRSELPAYAGTELSMGMSNDFELAVEEGSTLVRIGTTLFGARAP